MKYSIIDDIIASSLRASFFLCKRKIFRLTVSYLSLSSHLQA